MTRIIIFSDLHANWEALLALQQAEPQPDAVFCLGDMVGYGPDSKRCLDAVRVSATQVLGGRCDLSIGRPETGDWKLRTELMQATWAHTRSVLSPADRDYLAALPGEVTVEMAGTQFCLTRLAPDDEETETRSLATMPQARLRELFSQVEAKIILLGGPHIPALRQVDDRLIICPGSLGQPRYGVPDPTFAAWQDGRVQIHHLHYHPQATIHKLLLLPLDPEHVVRLQSILQTGGYQ